MTIEWGGALKPKYLSIFRAEWDKGEYKRLSFRRTPIGWDFNIGLTVITYDNCGRVA